MRSRSVVTSFLTFTAGVTASVIVRRLARRRSVAPVPAVQAAPAAVPAEVDTVVAPSPEREGVVLAFARPAAAAAPAPVQPAAPARCGENGGRTKAGAPCAARATAGGRCHHHRVAA